MSKNKKPKTKVNPSSAKRPKIASSPNSFYNMNPSWRISRLEMLGFYGWHKLDTKTLLHVKDKLASFETMTWAEILVSSKKFNHSVNVNDLCSIAQARLSEIGQDDIDELVSLRLSGKERVWGILDLGVLTLLWWDPEHEVCPSILKNT
ncbi:hypothetical protein [Scytonema sp. NUACC26]|uniref:hypothetical protein n=1 Tax=Scytonema sp. NUACC26 TaxID=3140176 RepID=UPI0034DB877C